MAATEADMDVSPRSKKLATAAEAIETAQRVHDLANHSIKWTRCGQDRRPHLRMLKAVFAW
jgi:hypothetical protein